MPSFYTCPICGEKVERELLTYIAHGDLHIVDEIKKRHPDWKCEDGLCPKCLECYRQMKEGERC